MNEDIIWVEVAQTHEHINKPLIPCSAMQFTTAQLRCYTGKPFLTQGAERRKPSLSAGLFGDS
jgi:hypothetical protein